jgi:hypothetical protein
MVFHKCEICNFSSKIKTHLNRHLKTQKHINNENNNKDYEEENNKKIEKGLKKDLKGLFFLKKGLKKDLKGLFSEKKGLEKDFFLQEESDQFVCQYCFKSLKTRPIMLRHIRKTCKEKNELDKMEEKENENSKIIEKQNKVIESQSNKINKIEKKLEKSVKQINNTQNNNNSNNTINNTIHINNYGEENLEMLTDEFKERCVTKPFYAILEIIKKIHFNDDYPENKNMRIVNKRDNKIQVLDDGKWKYRYKDEAVKYAFDDSNERLEQFCVEKSHKFRKFIKICCEDIIKNIHECEPELYKELYKEMDLILLNGC